MNNYNIEHIQSMHIDEIYKLFNLNPDTITRKELKDAYRKTLEFHPDKSGLSSSYFILFSNAYKRLHHHAHNILFKKDRTVKEYKETRKIPNDITEDYEHYIHLLKHDDDFQNKFNKTFETIIPNHKTDGYGDWLKQQCNTKRHVHNLNDLHHTIEKQKQTQNALVCNTTLNNVNECNHGTNLIDEKPKTYSSNNIFGKFKYEDIKKVHGDESVIPITQKDIYEYTYNRPETIQTYKTQRIQQNTTPITKLQGKQYLNDIYHYQQETYENVKKKLKQEEETSKQNLKLFWSNFMRIKN